MSHTSTQYSQASGEWRILAELENVLRTTGFRSVSEGGVSSCWDSVFTLSPEDSQLMAAGWSDLLLSEWLVCCNFLNTWLCNSNWLTTFYFLLPWILRVLGLMEWNLILPPESYLCGSASFRPIVHQTSPCYITIPCWPHPPPSLQLSGSSRE